MRLLNTTTGRFKSFPDPRAIRYAILSHVWVKPNRKNPSRTSEQTYEEILKFERETPSDEPILDKLSPKIQGACQIAREHDFPYIWIDTCCIDKSRSAEESEAINSMFEWYRHANICYALLDDVEDNSIVRASLSTSGFRHSKWFRRGWTLQELLAPRHVLFVSSEWNVIGTKAELADEIAEVTLIRREILLGESKLEDIPVSERMSWASKRETTREEDEAYCLLGIFGIQMSPIYGEGRYAFIRLQEEILRHTADPTILTWGLVALFKDHFSFPAHHIVTPDTSEVYTEDSDSARSYLLALSPSSFESHSTTITMSPQPIIPAFDIYSTDFTFTAHGIRTKLPLITIYDKNKKPYRLAMLGCKDKSGRYIALLLQWRRTPNGHRSFSVGASLDASLASPAPGRSAAAHIFYYRLLAVDPSDIQGHIHQIIFHELCIPHRPPPSLRSQVRDETIHASLQVYRQDTEMSLAGWCSPLLKQRGFTVQPDIDPHEFRVLSMHEFKLVEQNDPQRGEIRVQVGLCTREECAQQGLLYGTVLAPRTSSATSRAGSVMSDRPQCHDSHIAAWQLNDCVASKAFPIVTANGDPHMLRLTLRLRTEPGRRNYVVEIELLDPLEGAPPPSPPRSARHRRPSTPPSADGRDDVETRRMGTRTAGRAHEQERKQSRGETGPTTKPKRTTRGMAQHPGADASPSRVASLGGPDAAPAHHTSTPPATWLGPSRGSPAMQLEAPSAQGNGVMLPNQGPAGSPYRPLAGYPTGGMQPSGYAAGQGPGMVSPAMNYSSPGYPSQSVMPSSPMPYQGQTGNMAYSGGNGVGVLPQQSAFFSPNGAQDCQPNRFGVQGSGGYWWGNGEQGQYMGGQW